MHACAKNKNLYSFQFYTSVSVHTVAFLPAAPLPGIIDQWKQNLELVLLLSHLCRLRRRTTKLTDHSAASLQNKKKLLMHAIHFTQYIKTVEKY